MRDRRELITLALGTASALGAADAASAQAGRSEAGSGGMSLAECIVACQKCHTICLQTASGLLGAPQPGEPSVVLALLDCADICQTTANALARGSALHAIFCAACAQVCENCAEACAKATRAATLNRCAKLCRDCAMSCRHMAGLMH